MDMDAKIDFLYLSEPDMIKAGEGYEILRGCDGGSFDYII